MLEQRRGRINQDFRLRAADGHYFWFRLQGARPVVGPDGEVVRIVGTLSRRHRRARTREERLLHDAVHDNLTGLPNREFFFDRLDAGAGYGADRPEDAPDRAHASTSTASSRSTSRSALSAGDSILLTLARRLGRLLQPQDTLARLSGDQFAVIHRLGNRDRAGHRARRYGAPRRSRRR